MLDERVRIQIPVKNSLVRRVLNEVECGGMLVVFLCKQFNNERPMMQEIEDCPQQVSGISSSAVTSGVKSVDEGIKW